MLRFVSKIAAAAIVFAGVALAAPALAQDAQKTFYLLSHGGPSDAFWIDWNAGATKACDQVKVTCKISFSGGDMAAQKEAFNSALAAKPDGIATTSAQPGLWNEEVKAAKAAGVPIVSSTPTIQRPAGRPMSAPTSGKPASSGRNIWSTTRW